MSTPLDVGLPTLLVIAGFALVVAEAMAPGAHLIVLGVALLSAGLVGLVGGSVFAPLATPLVLAVLVLLFGGAALYVYREFDLYRGTGQGRTADADSLRGHTGRVTERVTETAGQVKLEGGGFNPHYAARAASEEIPAGAEVIVVDPGGGNVLTVESVEYAEDDIERELAAGRRSESGAESPASDSAASESGAGGTESDAE